MKKVCFLILLSGVICLFTICKKKTSIEVIIYNAALDELVANASVVLVEKKGESDGLKNAECVELAKATTDANGLCHFDKEKLRSNSNYKYFCAVVESWGVSQTYPCGGKTSGFIAKGEEQQIIVEDNPSGIVRVQYNNLLNPSQPGDSMIVSLTTIPYNNPKGGVVPGGGGVFGAFPHYNIESPPNNPPSILGPEIIVKGQKLKRSIRKRKMGFLTLHIDTIKVYPGRTTIVEFNW